MVKININEFVKVKLTEHGKEILEAHPQWNFYAPDSSGELRLQLWDFMRIFGGHVLDDKPLIVKNTLVIGDANEHV